MTELVFPNGFLWGTATAAHQVEGGNSNSDWWEWETRPGSRCVEPSGNAIEHYERYAGDVALLASLGYNMYRFSVEWARVEPSEGTFDEAQIAHYVAMVDAVRASGMIPMVTLNHFTLPMWLAAKGGWAFDGTPALFERYVRRVVEAIGDRVDYYCTINEPGVVAFGGYLPGLPFPPGRGGMKGWHRAIDGLIAGHRRALAAIKELRPSARVGLTHALQEWQSNKAGRVVVDYGKRHNEDVFLEASADDDFIGVQTYSRACFDLSALEGAVVRLGMAIAPIRGFLAPRVILRQVRRGQLDYGAGDVRRTQMGWEYRPQAVVWTVRRVAEMYPDKDVIVTENGVATADDAERIEFVTAALTGLHRAIDDGIRLRGYTYWSGFDNFEWASGYAPMFGLIGVDRTTQVRTVKPSARWLGEIARANRLTLDGGVPSAPWPIAAPVEPAPAAAPAEPAATSEAPTLDEPPAPETSEAPKPKRRRSKPKAAEPTES